jgi:hypothetical protein
LISSTLAFIYFKYILSGTNKLTSLESKEEFLVVAAESPFSAFEVVLRLLLRPLNDSFMTGNLKMLENL